MRNKNTPARTLAVFALTLIALVGLDVAGAQEGEAVAVEESPPWSPPTHSGDPISLMDAVRTTLENNPEIRLQDESTRFQMGLLQQASGEFDWTLISGLSYQKIRSKLKAAVIESEQSIRDKIAESFAETEERVVATDQVLGELRQLQQNPTSGQVSDPLLQTAVSVLNNLITNAGSASERQELTSLRDDIIDDALITYETLAGDLQVNLAEDLTDLENLGDVPDEEERYTGQFDLLFTKTTRSGFSFGPLFEYELFGNQYVGKPIDTDHGGKGIEDVYRVTVGFFFDTPLLRGLGKGSAGALERAAEIEYQASLATLRQSATISLFSTLLAYWEVVGAEEQVTIFERSAELQSRLVELTEALIEADEQPASELARVKAVEADRLAALDAARRSAYQARLRLAQVMGLNVDDETQAPSPADGFPPEPEGEEMSPDLLPELQRLALDRRDDLDAALLFDESGRVLLRAAEIDLKPILDLSTRVWGMAATEESAGDAFSADWAGPSYNLGLDFFWPMANNTQEGLHLQAASVSGIRNIQATDLDRLIRSGVVETWGSLEETVTQLRFAAEAVEFYGQTVESEIERYRHGVATLIDTLLTEQRLTQSLLFQTLTQQQYARLLAQLRFDTGTLIVAEGEGGMVIEESLLTLPSAGASSAEESEDG